MTIVTIPEPYWQAMTRDGATVQLGPGEYADGDQNNYCGKGVTVRGAGMSATRIVNIGYKQSAQGCAWALNSGVRIQDIALECRTSEGQQNQVVGFQGVPLAGQPGYLGFECPNDALVELVRVGIYGRTFSLYMYGGYRNAIHAYNCYIEAGQFAALAGSGSGDDAQFLYLYNCHLSVDSARLLGAGGDHGHNACALGAQGGQVFMYGGKIRVKGSPKAERSVGAWATKFPATPPAPKPDWPYKFPFIELHNCDCKVEANGCTGPVADAIGDVGPAIKIRGGTGSGKNGAWRVRGKVEVFGATKEVI